MKEFASSLWKAVLMPWHVAIFITSIAVLAVWLAAWWSERTIGQALPRFVAALPENYHPVLLNMAAFTVKPSRRDLK